MGWGGPGGRGGSWANALPAGSSHLQPAHPRPLGLVASWALGWAVGPLLREQTSQQRPLAAQALGISQTFRQGQSPSWATCSHARQHAVCLSVHPGNYSPSPMGHCCKVS